MRLNSSIELFTKNMSSPNTEVCEFHKLWSIFTISNHPNKFVETNMKECQDRTRILTVEKKHVYIIEIQTVCSQWNFFLLEFDWLNIPRCKTMFIFDITKNLKDIPFILIISICFYKLSCSCEAAYISRTLWKMLKSISDHYFLWYI